MDLGEHNQKFDLLGQGANTMPASATLSADIARELLLPLSAHVQTGLGRRDSREDAPLPPVQAFYRGEIGAPRRLVFVSSGIEAITGYDPETFLETPYHALIEPEDLPELHEIIEQALARREPFSACYRIRCGNGEMRLVGERGKVVCDRDGQPRYLEGVIAEVIHASTASPELTPSRGKKTPSNARIRRILENAPDCVISVDRNWNYTYLNKRALEDMAGNRAAIAGPALDAMPAIVQSPFWPALRDAMDLRQETQAQGFVSELSKWYALHAMPDETGLTIFFRDISRDKALEKSLQDQVADFRNILDSIPHLVWTALPDGTPDYSNEVCYKYIGAEPKPIFRSLALFDTDLFHPDDRERLKARWRRSVEQGEAYECEYRIRHCSGEYRWILARARPLLDDQGAIVRWYGSSTDIHEHFLTERDLRESQILQSNILSASLDCIMVLSLDGTLLQISDPGLQALEIEESASVIGGKWPELWPQKGRVAARNAVRTAREGKSARFTGYCPTLTGKPRWWDNVLTPIGDDSGQVKQILCVARDITEQRLSADRLRQASECDPLTGLPNRRAFEAHLDKVAESARESGRSIGLMLLDLDHFKHVNDTLGHLAGDHLLRVLAKRLQTDLASTDFVARLGGDEFAIVVEDIADDAALLSAARAVHARLAGFVDYGGQPINGGLSIGCALYPRDASEARGLFKHADTALYDLKTGGRGGVQMFSTRMLEAAQGRAAQLNLARRIIRDDVLEPHYQPKVRLDTGEVIGFEALLRWRNPEARIQPPSAIAEAFNDYELAASIGNRMQERVLADVAAWQAAGLTPPPVSINAAPAEFLRDDFAEHLLGRLAEHGVAPSRIELEITEHAFLARRSDHVVRALNLLKAAGISIALDDFGTGHSSLSHLRDFPVDVIKLDRSFIARMLDEPAMMAIVTAMVQLGPSLSLDIIAEGIETPEQLHALRTAGCGFGQGYLFGEAVAASAIAESLE